MKTILLICLTISAWTFADSTVPVPDPTPTGTITVQGVAGASQEQRKVWIEALTRDAKGNLKRATTPKALEHSLGETIPLPAGSYEILYSRTMMFVELGAGENKVIELKKILVPKVDGTYKVKVFADLTAGDEFNKRLQDLWGLGYDYERGDGTDGHGGAISLYQLPRDQAQVICLHTKNGKWKGVGAVGCSAWTGASYLGLGRGVVKTDKDANFWVLELQFYFVDYDKNFIITSVQPLPDKSKFVNYGRRELGNGVDGDFFSVLPGTYGLEFTTLTGKVSTQLGIVLN
jgi:hypothetical protein